MPADLEVALVPYERGGPYPGLYLFSGSARMTRPVLQLPGGSPELIGTLEQINLHIRWAADWIMNHLLQHARQRVRQQE